MNTMTSIITGHGGGKKGGGAKSMDDTLRSVARAIFIDALSEGPIVGLVDGENSIYVNRTPLTNIKDSAHQVRLGLPDDDPVEGIDGTEAFQNVGVQISQTVGSQVRTVLDTELDVVRIYMTLGNLYSISSKGAMRTTNTGWDIDIRPAGGDWTRAVTARLNGEKCTSPVQFQHNIRVKDFGAGPWDIRISAAYPDRTGDKIYEQIQWDGMSLLTEGKFSYPHTALVSLDLSSEHVGGSVPARHYHIKGRLVRVPSNYDPATRQYAGIWDGSFKRAWTDNPAWVYFDIATDRIFGLGNELEEYVTNKWQLYGIAQHCDTLVPSGYKNEAGAPIMEPRYTFNGVITDKKDAIEALRSITTVWRGMGFYSASQFHVTMDAPQDVAHIYGPANVIDGRFEYQTSSVKARHTVVMVRFNDPDNLFEPAIEPVIDNEGVHQLGWREKTVELVGCSSRSLARRYGQWILDTEKNETETASFSVGMDSIHALPGEVIAIADPRRAQVRCSGRITEVADGRHVRMDQAIDASVARTDATFYVQGADGSLKTHKNRSISTDGEWIDLGVGNASSDLIGRVFILSASNVAPREYRIVSIDERSDGATYDITALQFDRTKFARIEQGVNFAPLPNRVDVSTVNKVRSLVANGRTFTDGGQVRTEITLGWAPPLDTLVREYQITVDTPTAKGVPVATTILNSTSFSATDPGIYTFHVRTVSFTGQVSDPETATFTAEGAVALSSSVVTDLVNAVTGLNVGDFTEPDLHLRWKNMIAVSDAPGADLVEDDPANYDATILRFYTGATYLGERRVRGNTFVYTLEMNRADSIAAGRAGPSRDLTVVAYIIDAAGNLSAPTSISLFNSPPAVVTPAVSISGNQIFVSLPKSEDPDHEGYLVWLLKSSGSVVGITPSAILSGTQFSQFVEEGADYWVTVASFDAFGINDLNYSTPIAVRSRFDLDRIANEAHQGLDDAMNDIAAAAQLAIDNLNVAKDYTDTSVATESAARVAGDLSLATQIQTLTAVLNSENYIINPRFIDGKTGWGGNGSGPAMVLDQDALSSDPIVATAPTPKFLSLAPLATNQQVQQIFDITDWQEGEKLQWRLRLGSNETLPVRVQTTLRRADNSNIAGTADIQSITLSPGEWRTYSRQRDFHPETKRVAFIIYLDGSAYTQPMGLADVSVTRVDTSIKADLTELQGAFASHESAQTLWQSNAESRFSTIEGDVSTNATNISNRYTKAEADAATSVATNALKSSLEGPGGSIKAAQDAAQAANDLAGGKGKVFFQNTAPATAERLTQNLWIDTTGGNNTPKRWNGTAWVAVTDKVATDAAAAAASALSGLSTKLDASVITNYYTKTEADTAIALISQRAEAYSTTQDLVLDPTFALDFTHWPNGSPASNFSFLNRNLSSTTYVFNAMPAPRALVMTPANQAGGQWKGTSRFPVTVGEEILLSMSYARNLASGVVPRLLCRCYDKDGVNLGVFIEARGELGGAWNTISARGTVPAGAVEAQVYLIGQSSGSPTTNAWITNVSAKRGQEAYASGLLKIESVTAGPDAMARATLQVRAEGQTSADAAIYLEAMNDGTSTVIVKSEGFFVTDGTTTAPIFAVMNGEVFVTGRLTAQYLDVDGLITIKDSGALSAFKQSSDDTTDGIYFGKVEDKFALSASRTALDGRAQEISFTSDGFILRNPRFSASGSAPDPVVRVLSNLASTSLAPAKMVRIPKTIGGGGGGGAWVDGNGGLATIVRLYDGATLKLTLTANGGAGGRGGAKTYGREWEGLPGLPPDNRGGGGNGGTWQDPVTSARHRSHGGKSGKTASHDWIDISTWADPRIEITLGTGGAGGAGKTSGDTPGSAGQPGEASYQTISAADIRTDTVPLIPTGFGSFPKAANTAGSFPDLGPGMWVLVEANGNALGLGTVDLGNGRSQGMNTPSCITFISSQTPAYSGGANGRTIQYLHFSMGNWA